MQPRALLRPLATVTAVLTAAALALLPPDVQAQGPIELNIGSLAPKGSPWMNTLEEMKARIERESHGRIHVIIRPPGLMAEVEMARETVKGERLQACAVTTAAIAEGAQVPQLSLLDLPFLFRDQAEADYVLDNVLIEPMGALLAERGLVLALWSENGWRSFATRGAPIRTPEDLKKFTMRSQESEVHKRMYQAFGASTVEKPATEVLTALQANDIHGLDNTALYIQSGGITEAIDYFTETRHIYQPAALVFHKGWFDKLPPDLRKVVLEARALALEGRASLRAEERAMIENFELFAVEVVELSDAERESFAAVTRPMHAAYAASVEGGTELLQQINAAIAERRK